MALSKQSLEESRASEYNFSMWLLRHMPFLYLPCKGVAHHDIAKYEINCLRLGAGRVTSSLLGTPMGCWLGCVSSEAFSLPIDARIWGHFKAWIAQQGL